MRNPFSRYSVYCEMVNTGREFLYATFLRKRTAQKFAAVHNNRYWGYDTRVVRYTVRKGTE